MQKDKKFTSLQKNKDNIKLLFSDTEFNKKIKDIREYLDIPENGFDVNSAGYEKQYKEWQKLFFKKGEDIMNSKEFESILKEYSQQLKNHEIGFKQYKDLCYKHHDIIPVNYLTRQSENLTSEFNVPLQYKDSIRNYILFNDLGMTPGTPFTEMRGTSDNRNEQSISLTFYSKITDGDLKLVKEAINRNFEKDLPDISPLKELEINLAIEEYHRNRDVYDPLEQKHYMLSAKEIAENIEHDTGKKIKPDHIYEVIRTLKELRNKRFRKSGKD